MSGNADDLTPAQHYAINLADNQREKAGTLDVRPRAAQVRDYAEATIKIAQGLQGLDESLPNGQLRRTYNAFMLCRAGVEELAVWLRDRGVEV